MQQTPWPGTSFRETCRRGCELSAADHGSTRLDRPEPSRHRNARRPRPSKCSRKLEGLSSPCFEIKLPARRCLRSYDRRQCYRSRCVGGGRQVDERSQGANLARGGPRHRIVHERGQLLQHQLQGRLLRCEL